MNRTPVFLACIELSTIEGSEAAYPSNAVYPHIRIALYSGG
jgi:hypothetical protein